MIYLDVKEEWCLFCEIKEWGSIGGIFGLLGTRGDSIGFWCGMFSKFACKGDF